MNPLQVFIDLLRGPRQLRRPPPSTSPTVPGQDPLSRSFSDLPLWHQRQLEQQQAPQAPQRATRPVIDRSGPTPRAPIGARLTTIDGRTSGRASKRYTF